MPVTQRFKLISAGRSDCRIALSPKARGPEVFAAQELQRYLARMTGVALPICERARSGPLLRVGAPDGQECAAEQDSEDAFVIRCEGPSLVLAGASPRATLYTVYAFLEDVLGCAWLSPADEHVPQVQEVSVPPLDRIYRPDFASRILVHFPCPTPRTLGQVDWAAKRRLNESFLATNNDMTPWDDGTIQRRVLPELERRGLRARTPGHSFAAWLPPARYAKDHPEYYALVGGERRPGVSLCISNPAVAAEVAANIGAFADRYPLVRTVALWHNDHDEWCACPTCVEWLDTPETLTRYARVQTAKERRLALRKGRSRTAAEMRFVNRVADCLARTHPDLRIETLAYGSNYAPSGLVSPAENVPVGFAMFERLLAPALARRPLSSRSGHNRDIAQWVKAWRGQTDRLYLYEYFGFLYDFAPAWDAMRRDFAAYVRAGISGISSEIGTTNDLHMYLFAALAWNSRASVDALLREWCRASYGPAAETMQAFWQALRRADLPWDPGYLSTRRTGLSLDEWNVRRRKEARWARVERRCLDLLDSAVGTLARCPLIRSGPCAAAEPQALDRVRRLRGRWHEPAIPWWRS